MAVVAGATLQPVQGVQQVVQAATALLFSIGLKDIDYEIRMD